MEPLELPYPAKILWPNGRGHFMLKSRETKKHKLWAFNATLASGIRPEGMTLRLVATFHPKTRNEVDRDNASASLKAYQDGIAAALRVDDKHFAEPSISFGEPIKGGRVFIVVEAV